MEQLNLVSFVGPSVRYENFDIYQKEPTMANRELGIWQEQSYPVRMYLTSEVNITGISKGIFTVTV